MMATEPTAVGVAVGGTQKGFHAVALRHNQIVAKPTTCSALDVATLCREQGAAAVGIDAPCQWSLTGRARPCERELAGLGMSVFSTPSQAVGQVHPFYRWMVNGAELFRLLVPDYRLYDGRSAPLDPLCFETFPQAIACSLAGRNLSAKNKRADRRRLLVQAGISSEALPTIDDIDAALCALSVSPKVCSDVGCAARYSKNSMPNCACA